MLQPYMFEQLPMLPLLAARCAKRFGAIAVSPLFATLLCSATFQAGTAELAESSKLSSPSPLAPTTLAQILPLRSAAQRGTQVSLNGRTWPIAWSQWQPRAGQPASNTQRIGISDTGLMRAIGVELLDTKDLARQPVQWFSNSGLAPLPAQLTHEYRYLDITDLAQWAGWRVQADGETLRISSPPAKVLGIRQGRQSWGERIVIDLDQSTPWQLDELPQEAVITLDAEIDPVLSQQLQPGAGSQLKSIKLETKENQTIIRASLPAGLRPRVWTLPNPNRLIIDVRADALVERDILWAAGVRWRQQNISIRNARFPVVWLELNPGQPGLRLQPISANSTTQVGIAPLIQTAQRWQASAAINGGFFNRNNQLPLGAIRQSGRWLSGPILNRGAIAWDDTGNFYMGRLSLQETLTTSSGQRLSLRSLNSGYVQAGIARYTPEWGPTYTPLINNEVVVIVQNNQVTGQQTAGVAGTTSIPIPKDGYLLAVRANNDAVSAFPVGTPLKLESVTAPFDFSRYPHVLGGGPLLVQNRQIVLDAKAEQFSDAFIKETAVRSAIGRTAEGTLIVATVQNRIGGVGPTLAETAQLMQQLGAVDALNLDGGSSTALYLGGQLLNRSPRTAARVHNGIGIFIQPNP